jgi:branched-chain amino acid transport system substrate-binding protein
MKHVTLKSVHARAVQLALVVPLVLVAAACGSAKPATPSEASGTTTAAPSATSAALTGAPVKFGWIDIEGDLGIDFTPQRKVAQAAVQQINTAGGIGGHPVQLISCATKAASGGADCANQMIQDKVSLVLSFSTIDTSSIYPILKAAGIPLLGSGASPLNAPDLTPDGDHFFITAGALAQYAAGNVFISKTLKLKHIGVVVGSNSAAQQAAAVFVKAPLQALGVKVDLATISETNPDYTSAINAVYNTNGLMVLLTCSAQDAVVQQAVQLGYKGKIFGCGSAVDIHAMGSAAANVYSATQVIPATSPAFANDPGVKAFIAFTAKYGTENSLFSEQAYALVQAAEKAVITAGGPAATTAQIRTAIASSSHWQIPLLSASGMTCSTVLSKIVPTGCNVDTMFVQVQPDLKSLKAISGFITAAG